MAHQVPTREPETLRAGDNATWTRSLPDYLPADGWTLKYALTNAGAAITFTATDNGDGSHLVDVVASTTVAWAAGTYVLQGYVEKGTARYTVFEGYVEITPALHAGAVESRSLAKQILDALEAMILGKASRDQASYTIAGRSLQHLSPDELIRWRDHYATLWAREQEKLRAAAGRGSGRTKRLHFGKVS